MFLTIFFNARNFFQETGNFYTSAYEMYTICDISWNAEFSVEISISYCSSKTM